MLDVSCTVTGQDAIRDALDRKAKQAVKNYIRRAAKDAADIWVKAIEDKAPRDTGFLAEHIAVMTRFRDGGARLELHVGPVKEAFYALFQEFGTEFQKAQPFMRPAFEEHKEEVMQAFADALKVSLVEIKA